jgi:hypothetical protein
MAEEKMALVDVLRKGDEPDGDVLVDGLRWLLQELMDAEVSAQIGAGRYERNGERGRSAKPPTFGLSGPAWRISRWTPGDHTRCAQAGSRPDQRSGHLWAGVDAP